MNNSPACDQLLKVYNVETLKSYQKSKKEQIEEKLIGLEGIGARLWPAMLGFAYDMDGEYAR